MVLNKTWYKYLGKTENIKLDSTYIGYAPIKDPKLSFSIVYTNQPVPPPG